MKRIKLPPFSKFRHLPKVLSAKEKIWLAVFGILAAGSLIYLTADFYRTLTRVIPKFGGELIEGIAGEPRFLNPLLRQSDADRDLSEIIFSGLAKYGAESKIVPDLAKNWEISGDGKIYTVFLREDVFWHDGKKFGADDVIFTIALAQNPDYKSPLRFNWQGVKTEKISDFALKFSLPNPYAPFLENLTLKILPRHIWENVPAKSFTLAEFNVKPVGAGPYLVKSFQKDKQGQIKSYELAAFPKYFPGKPHIESLKFIFFDSEESLIAALNKKTVMAGAAIRPKNLEKIKKSGLSVLNLKMPRYYAVFFNAGRSKILENKPVRLALNLAADKSQIVEKALAGKGIVVDSPILPGYLGYGPVLEKYEYNPEKAKEILEKAKLGSPFEITLTIPQSQELIEAAAMLRDDWQKIGVKTNLRVLAPPEIQEAIKQRDYEAIIFGEILNLDPDPFPFWHSSQKNDPGLNLAMYENKQADKLLEEARQTLKENERAQKYESFQKILIEDAPAVFLYSPDYIYLINKKIKGIELKSVVLPSKRFGEIEKWYIETERVWK